MHAEVLYNYEDDKGVRLDVVESDENFDEILKATETDILDVYKPLDVVQFLPDLGQYPPITDTSCLSIKITTFSCGIIAISVNVSHALADALVLQQFLSLWSSVYNGEKVKAPIFNPREIDELAQPLEKKDPEKLKRATKFPAQLYDLWNSKEALPERFSRMCEGPEEIVAQEPLGEPLSFADLASSQSYKFKFSAVEIESMYQDLVKSGFHVSRMNALIAHFWTCVNRARKSNYARLFQVIGIKRRLSAEKDFNNHFGCFVICGLTETTGNATFADNAKLFSEHLQQYTVQTISDLLHSFAHNLCPTRHFHMTFDEPSTVSTTWVGADDYPIKFGKFLHYETFYGPSSGLMVILSGNASNERDKWHDDGAYIFYSARQEVLDSLIDDPELRKWR